MPPNTVEFFLLAVSSFGIGALHALEPGHGKTIVGAYLIGSRGRISDAVLLGIVVTLTHSGSVIILGILSTIAAAYFVPETVQKVLELVSGLLVVGVGGWMLGVRIRQVRGHSHQHPHDQEHIHTHENNNHDHAHGHSHSHVHHTLVHPPQTIPGKRPSIWQLIILGVSGGVVPCPGALAVLLAAISLGQFAKGLSLVIIFSLGMATVLVAIGIVMVKAANVASKYVSESKWTWLVPIISASIITLMGVGLTIKAVFDFMR